MSNDTYADLLVDPTNARAEGSAAVARAASAKWRKHDSARRAFLGPQQAALDEILLDKIQIRAAPASRPWHGRASSSRLRSGTPWKPTQHTRTPGPSR